MYAAPRRGDIEPERLRRVLASSTIPKSRDGRITLAVDVSNWLRPDADTSDPPHAEELFNSHHTTDGISKVLACAVTSAVDSVTRPQ